MSDVDRQQTILGILQNLNDLDGLKRLFWHELNYERENKLYPPSPRLRRGRRADGGGDRDCGPSLRPDERDYGGQGGREVSGVDTVDGKDGMGDG